MPSWASISSKPWLTSSSVIRCESSDSTSISPASQRSTSSGTCVRPLTPPNDEPVTRRPVIRKRGTTSSTSPLPATPHIVARPHASRADSTACRITDDEPGRLEGVVGAEAAGLGLDPVDRVLAGDARLGRSVVARLREPSLGEVDRDDPLGAGEPAADHGAEADEAAAEDDARRAGLDPRRVERGADAGREAAGERCAAVERRLRADLRERDLGHHGVLRERRRAHEVPQRLAVAREPRGAVGEVAEALLVADRDAAVGAVAEAVDALAALGREERDHVVAGRDERDAVADALDDAGALVPEHARRVAGRVGARRRCRGRCGRRRRRRAGRAPRPPSARRGRSPGRRAGCRTPRALLRGSSWREPTASDRGERQSRMGHDLREAHRLGVLERRHRRRCRRSTGRRPRPRSRRTICLMGGATGHRGLPPRARPSSRGR